MSEYKSDLRDEIAIKVLQEFMSKVDGMTEKSAKIIAVMAYVVADAMLEARKGQNE